LTINHSKVIAIKDYKSLISRDILAGKEVIIHLPESDVLQFFLEDGSKISVRPSGTEPKIKFYFGVMDKLKSRGDFDIVNQKLEKRIDAMITDLKLLTPQKHPPSPG